MGCTLLSPSFARGFGRDTLTAFMLEPPMRTTVSTKGQIVLPLPVRAALGLVPGSELEVIAEGDQVILRRPSRFKAVSAAEALGCAGYEGPMRTIDDMNHAVANVLRTFPRQHHSASGDARRARAR